MEQLLKKLGITERDLSRVLPLLRQKQLELLEKRSRGTSAQQRQVEGLLEEIEKAIMTLSWIVKDKQPTDAQSQEEPAAASRDPGISLTYRLASGGDPQSQFELGGLYRSGKRLDRDDALAAKWYRRAAFQDHAGAQLILGVMYGSGRAPDQNQEEILSW